MYQTFLKVREIFNSEATNGRKYQKVTFELIKFFNNMQIKTQQVRTRNLWDTGHTASGTEVKADAHYNNLYFGDMVDGDIVTLNTTPYKIGDRLVNQWSGVVFAGENPIVVANNQLKNNNAVVVDEHGQPTKNVAVTPAPKEAEPEPVQVTATGF